MVINRDGWIVTAAHMLQEFGKLTNLAQQAIDHDAKRSSIEADPHSDAKSKKRQLQKFGHLPDDHVDRCSAWWGHDGVTIDPTTISVLGQVDLAVARLRQFDPGWVPAYPVMKNPSINFGPGTSLCRVGYPFFGVDVTWDAASEGFRLPFLQPPSFAIEGIFSREIEFTPPPGAPLSPWPFPLKFIETSSPGLRGQSGGPIFDTLGRVWGIQSQTRSYPLGFSPPVPGSKKGEQAHQFLNVGWGIHAASVAGTLRDLGVTFEQSAD